MERRTVLTALAVAAGGLAGCGGGDEDTGPGGDGTDEPTATPTASPTPQALHFPDYSFEEGDDGSTVVVLVVENRGPETRDRTLRVVIHGPEGQDRESSVDVSLDPEERSTVRVPFDVEWSWFADNINLQGINIE